LRATDDGRRFLVRLVVLGSFLFVVFAFLLTQFEATPRFSVLLAHVVGSIFRLPAQLLALLTVFQEGNLDDYSAFLQSNGGNAEATLAQWDLKADDCSRYIRILSLCSVAAAHEEIPYSLVAKALQTTPDEVEKWVIAAVSSGLLSAKMDQLQEKVIVERCVVRKFDMEQWRALQARLHLWKRNVGGILEAYKQNLELAKQQPAQQ
jgi:translation initiation factor 3 subunit M